MVESALRAISTTWRAGPDRHIDANPSTGGVEMAFTATKCE
jgi:hypothetical protein